VNVLEADSEEPPAAHLFCAQPSDHQWRLIPIFFAFPAYPQQKQRSPARTSRFPSGVSQPFWNRSLRSRLGKWCWAATRGRGRAV